MKLLITFFINFFLVEGSVWEKQYSLLIREIHQNAWFYVPRARYEKEVENCDIILHEPSLFVEDKVNIITSSNSHNYTVKERVEISHRPYYFRESNLGRGASHRRARKLYVETARNKSANVINCKMHSSEQFDRLCNLLFQYIPSA